MCGIVGFNKKSFSSRNLIKKMLKIISHRGPDNSSWCEHRDFLLGHRRLSIIDLATGDQPIYNEDNSLCVICNGEIYNYKEHKSQLIKDGHTFTTKSDTEVILHGFEQFGSSFFSKLNGIFAFALLEIKSETLFLVRDFFGVKPLHYYFKNGLLVFGSEQKSIILHPNVPRKINYQALHQQINLRYTQSQQTLFNGIKRLKPAHFLKYSKGKIEIKRYWQSEVVANKNISEIDAIEGIDFYLKQAVKRQLLSDVPVGVYLSGGLDSSSIVQKMYELGIDNINTFTLGFNEPTDEFSDAQLVAKKFETNHSQLSLEINPMDIFAQTIWFCEEPKINLLQGFHLSKFVNNKKVKVVLGGLGGDELFAGYDIHRIVNYFNWAHSIIPKWMQKIGQFKSQIIFNLQNISKTLHFDEKRRGIQMLFALGDIERFYLIIRNVWDYDKNFYKNIYSKNFLKRAPLLKKINLYFDSIFLKLKNLKALEQVLFVEMKTKMINDYLLVEDRMSMANSIEERVPFLDLDLVNFANSIPTNLKIKKNQTKYLFRKVMKDKLPKKIVEKKKWGFSVNPYLQFKKDLKTISEKVLTPKFVKDQGIFNYEYLKQILKYKPSPNLRWHYNYLWIVLGLTIWQKMYIETDNFMEKRFNIQEYC